MNEDISATVRTAVTYVLLSCVTIFVVVMVTIGVQRMNDASNMVSSNIGVMEQTTLINISGLVVSGASAYRIYSTYSGAVNDFTIKTKNGRTYSNMSQLMEQGFIGARFYVNSYQLDSGLWSVTLEEQ